MSRSSLSTIVIISGLVSACLAVSAAADDMKSAPTLVIKGVQPHPFGAIFAIELTNTIAKDVFVDLECTGSVDGQTISYGPWRTGDTMTGAVLVDAGKTVIKNAEVKMNALADYAKANPGKPHPLPTKTACKITKVEVMG